LKIVDRTFFRFLLVGVANTLVGSGVMFVIYNVFSAGYWVSSLCNYIVGSITSFFLNKYFTFQVRKWSVFIVITFALTIVFSYLVAYGMAKPLINFLLRSYLQRIRENAALFTGMCFFTGINYLCQRLIVFNDKSRSKIRLIDKTERTDIPVVSLKGICLILSITLIFRV
jgi:putative flippase GtrA